MIDELKKIQKEKLLLGISIVFDLLTVAVVWLDFYYTHVVEVRLEQLVPFSISALLKIWVMVSCCIKGLKANLSLFLASLFGLLTQATVYAGSLFVLYCADAILSGG